MSSGGTIADRSRNGNLTLKDCQRVLDSGRVLVFEEDHYRTYITRRGKGYETYCINQVGGYIGGRDLTRHETRGIIKHHLENDDLAKINQSWPGASR